MSTRIRKSARERKSEIVETALLLAAEVGPDRLSTEALAAAVGISQPGIFRHFPKKSDIWQAVAERIAELLKENWTAMENEDLGSADRMRSFVTGHLTFLQTTPAIPAILFSRELHAENEVLRSFFAGLMQRVHHFVSQMIASEIKAQRYHSKLDPNDAAYLILALIQGLAMRWSLNKRKFDLVEEGERLLALQLNGFKRSA
ncbi:MAG: TetR/AcrR family transcriptional regulator [Hyphomicrobiales bacterium]|nr:TetR/AcrR family transcriptional regulator [Hyphomicrobiales bacterium]